MTADEREIRRKRRILDHAVATGNIAKTWCMAGKRPGPARTIDLTGIELRKKGLRED